MKRIGWIWFPLALAACVPPAQDQTSETTGEIANGRIETQRLNVPRLSIQTATGSAGCTSTLVGTRTLLTAAHCVAHLDGSIVAYFPGSTPPVFGRRVEANGTYQANGDIVDNARFDVAIIELERDVPLEPAVIATAAPTVGQNVTLVGYGITSRDANDFGTLRSGSNTIERVAANTYDTSGATGGASGICSGDSGGPDFSTVQGKEYLVGVHSIANCDAPNVWGLDLAIATTTRADAALSFLRNAARGNLYRGDGHYERKPPTVSIEVSENLRATTPAQVTVHAADDVRVKRIELYADDAVLAADDLDADDAELDYDATVTLARGTHQLVAIVTDGAGNETEAKLDVKVAGDEPNNVPGGSSAGTGTGSGEGTGTSTSTPPNDGSAPAKGCAIAAGPSSAGGAWALVLLLVLALRRRNALARR